MTTFQNVFGVALLGLAACGGADKPATTMPTDAIGADASVPKVDPSLCETEGKNIVTTDLNKDNRPDVWRLFRTEDEGGTKTEVMTCKQVDFDHDGRKDLVVGYGPKGAITFERADFDYDGRIDMSSVYDTKHGTVAEIERDTDFDGKFDLRETYDTTGKLQMVKRDRNGDSKPDMWEQYKDGLLLAILYDEDFDNKVDRREEVPGARPKVEMPKMESGGAEADINAPASPAPTGDTATKK